MDFIALAGAAAELGVITLLFLEQASQERIDAGITDTAHLLDTIREGGVQPVRPMR